MALKSLFKNNKLFFWVHVTFIGLIFLSISFIMPVNAQFNIFTHVQEIMIIAGIYIISHCLRVARLLLLIFEQHLSVRKVFFVHFYSAAASRLLPFKLGEFYRVYNISQLLTKPLDAIVIVWIERLFDALMIGLLLIVALIKSTESDHYYTTLSFLLGAFIVLSLIFFFIIPENLSSLKRNLIIKYNYNWVLKLLKTIENINHFIKFGATLLAQKAITLLLLSSLIWLCEAVALGRFLIYCAKNLPTFKELPTILTQNFYQDNIFTFTRYPLANEYIFATMLSLLVIGLISFIFYFKTYHLKVKV